MKELMREAGLRVHEDAVGNIFGVWDLEEEEEKEENETVARTKTSTADVDNDADKPSRSNAEALPANLVLSGSHTDAIPLAGAYDGVVGVLGAIAALKSLREAASASSSNVSRLFLPFRPKRPLAAVMFSSEEPTRYGLSCLGSRALAGELPAERLASLRDENGTGFFESAAEAGVGIGASFAGKPSSNDREILSRAKAALSAVRLSKASKRTPPSVSAFLELHIEQAATLQEKGAALGVVTAIAAPAALDVSFSGPGGHAGALPMRLRADAGLVAAAFALDVERAALRASLEEGGGDDSVATVGRLSLSPGAVNSVPRRASLTVDVRDVSGPRRDRMMSRVREAAVHRARERPGVGVEVSVASEDAPAASDARVVAAAARAVRAVTGARDAAETTKAGKEKRPFPLSLFSPKPPPSLVMLPSRAYHDALFVSRVAPTGMIFVRCRNGWSHRPDEFASPLDIELGTKALALALAELAGDSGNGAAEEEGGGEHGAGGGEGGRCPVTGAAARKKK